MSQHLILATETARLPERLSKTGFHPFEHGSFLENIEGAGLWLGPRHILESSWAFRQIIPYIVLCVGDRILSYTRAAAGREDRLHGRLSIGLGGHVDFADIVPGPTGIDLPRTLNAAAEREVDEEVGRVSGGVRNWIGALIDNETEVGRVHLGIVGIWSLGECPDGVAEAAISNIALRTLDELEQSTGRMETWSRLLMPFIHEMSAGKK
ncbi:MAG: hypothetical protein HQK57_15625 [Deltaproteobacteria bacterium]|nr:hypothetical protein [Deltaproteobacteria bacterium]MBF0525219.1 hypothetical protein [Deltaproteobacteria bacterium]